MGFFRNIFNKENNSSTIPDLNSPEMEEYLYYKNDVDRIMDICWDEESLVFNWENWHFNKDDVIHCEDERISKYIFEEFKRRGNLQTNIICYILTNAHNADEALEELKKRKESIIWDIHLMYSYNSSAAPSEVLEFRDKLFDLIEGKITPTKQNFIEISNLGQKIQNI